MKKNFKILTVLAVITFAAIVFLNFTIYQSKTDKLNDKKNETKTEIIFDKESSQHEEKSCCENEQAESFIDNSIYQIDAVWRNEFNKEFNLSELKGKHVILTMFFADCAYACPILVNDMKRIEASIEKENLEDYRFVLISINPERDKPEVLKQYSIDHNLDLNRWILLTGSTDDIMELAALTGFKFKKNNDGNFSHSNLITFLNTEGEIVHQQTGLNQDITEAYKIISKLK